MSIYGDGVEIKALDGVDLQIPAGEILTVMGPSGSGKSTLLKLLGLIEKPTAGRIHFDGQPDRAKAFFQRAAQLAPGDDAHVRAFQ